jgi:hypothetical protein
MKPYLRLASHPNLQSLSRARDEPPSYPEALLKLIPAEVVGLYLGGKNAIEAYFHDSSAAVRAAEEPVFWLGWTVICFVAVIAVRRWATSDKGAAVPPEWPAVGLAAISFLVWVYSFGDVFRVTFHIWHALVATLLVLVWTFASPQAYRKYLGAK